MRAISVRVSGGLLLLLQAALLQVISALRNGTPEAFILFIALGALTALAILAAVGFFFLKQTGWLVAMTVQGLCLLVFLTLYFRGASLWVYVALIYAIVMVLYLNSFIVQTAFRADSVEGAGESQ